MCRLYYLSNLTYLINSTMGTLKNSLFLWRRCVISILLLIFAIGVTFAQGRVVKGKVTSATEGPLAGVNIVIQGTTQGIMTDSNGTYSINVPGSETVLVFSFIGYTPQAITVLNQTTIDVVLAPAMSALNEVVVTGYGTQKKREVTSSIVSVKSDEFNKGNVNNPIQLIQGKVAGLDISRPGSNPNGTYDIRLRGLSTIGANIGPLVVIDGVIGGSLDNVDPNDIESLNVLKDGSAAAIYGTRGSSGVILVTTKRGKPGQSVVEYDGYVTLETVAKNTPVMNASEWRSLSAETKLGTDFGASTDWFKAIEQTAISSVHNLSMSGGANKTSYRLSINYHDAEGIMITTGYKQLNGRINLTQKAMNDKLTLDANIGATEKISKYGFDAAVHYAGLYNPTSPIKSDDPAFDKYNGYFQQVLSDYYNPVSILEQNDNEGENSLMNLSLRGTYEIVKGLSVDAFIAVQKSGALGGQYYSKNEFWGGAAAGSIIGNAGGMNRNGLAERQEDNSSTRLFESTVHYIGDIGSSLNLSLLGGYSYQDFTNQGFHAEGGNFITNDFTFNNFGASLDFPNGLGKVTSYKDLNKLGSFFGRANLNINSLWFLTASARYEASTRFGKNHKWGLFPAFGVGMDLAKVINVSSIDNLKLRVNYGITGNQPSSSYQSLLRFGPQGNFFYNGSFVPGYTPVSNANPDLKWEKKGEFDAGFDFSILMSKFVGSLDFYTRTTTDLLFSYQVPVPPNLYNQALLNLGKIRSRGLELSLTWNAIKKSDFSYIMTFTPSYNIENTLISLSGMFNGSELHYGTQDLANVATPGQNGVPIVRVEEGKPIGQLYMLVSQGIDSQGNLIIVDQNNDGVIDQADRVVVANGLPKLLFGFNNTLSYKNWDLNVFFRGVFGHHLVNIFRVYEVPDLIQSYNVPKQTASDMRNASTGALLNNSSGILTNKDVENASFVSLDNLSLGYNFNLPKIKQISKLRLYLAGNNLFYLTKYTGADPNPRYDDPDTNNSPLVPGVDRTTTWFRSRSITIGANVVF